MNPLILDYLLKAVIQTVIGGICFSVCRFKWMPLRIIAVFFGLIPMSSYLILFYLNQVGTFEFRFMSQFIPVLIQVVDRFEFYSFYILKGGVVTVLLRLLYVRFIRPEVESFRFKKLKKGFISKDVRKINLSFKGYDGWSYINPKKGFFWGKNHQTNKALYLSFSALSKHLQVEGPSGAGKTESVLKPLAFQAMASDIPLVFVDGKADAGLAKQCHLFSKECGVEFFNFNTVEIEENGEVLDTTQTSHTFNPLLFSKDPAKLTDALVLALQLESNSDAKFYIDAQKAFLMTLFGLFIATGKAFTFIDVVEFMKYEDTREYVFDLVRKKGDVEPVDDMTLLLRSFDKNLSQLLGLKNIIEQLFVADKVISNLINVYESSINIKDILDSKQSVLFSLSAGDRWRSNMCIAKMIVSILNSLVGEQQGKSNKDNWLIILDEFGQFSTEAIKPLITTGRSTSTAIALSYQSKEQLNNVEGLAEIVTTNCDVKCIFKNPGHADEWAKMGGTIDSVKRTDVLQDDIFETETREGRSSLRQVDEFQIDPNVFRRLNTGQSVTKFANKTGAMEMAIIDHAMYPLQEGNHPRFTNLVDSTNGLYLKQLRKEKKIATNIPNNKIKIKKELQEELPLKKEKIKEEPAVSILKPRM